MENLKSEQLAFLYSKTEKYLSELPSSGQMVYELLNLEIAGRETGLHTTYFSLIYQLSKILPQLSNFEKEKINPIIEIFSSLEEKQLFVDTKKFLEKSKKQLAEKKAIYVPTNNDGFAFISEEVCVINDEKHKLSGKPQLPLTDILDQVCLGSDKELNNINLKQVNVAFGDNVIEREQYLILLVICNLINREIESDLLTNSTKFLEAKREIKKLIKPNSTIQISSANQLEEQKIDLTK